MSALATGESLELKVRGGSRICLPADLAEITSYVVLEQEDWFEDEIAWVRRALRPGMRAVDVGANYGLYALAMAQATGPTGRVWAYEPTPRTAAHLERSLRLNEFHQATLLRQAVSDRCGSVRFALRASSEFNGIAAHGDAQAVEVASTTLDQADAELGLSQLDFIKLDVEGHEREAVEGAARLLERESPLLMLEVKAGARTELGALDALAPSGFAFYRLLPGPLALMPFKAGEPLDGFALNLFACRAERAGALAAEGLLAQAIDAPSPPRDAWPRYVAVAPYARGIAERWPAKPGLFADAAERAYFKGLAAFAASRDPAASADLRCAWTEAGFAHVQEAVREGASFARQLSRARLAWETGRRHLAVDTLWSLVDQLPAEGERALAEPFLAPGARWERTACEDRPLEWLQCAVVEQLEVLRAYSSRFTERTSLELLDRIRRRSLRSPECDRRWQLVRLRNGLQDRPQPTPRLAAASEENLNPEFWCGHG